MFAIGCRTCFADSAGPPPRELAVISRASASLRSKRANDSGHLQASSVAVCDMDFMNAVFTFLL
jgi:hypothetical protein